MGRLGPLTSQALGRSPYDDVVDGTGEEDPHEPERQYDEKGRIVNPKTKQIIKNVIRAHNEVMLVIGVAEPENSGGESPEAIMAKEHQAYESETGRSLLSLGRSLGILGIWGVHGVRQRIMLYKPYSNLQFYELLQYEQSQRSLKQLFLTGLPSFIAMQGIHWTRLSVDWVQTRRWLRFGLAWSQFHFHIFLTMQRLGLLPGSPWFPSWKFFIPFSSESPLVAPPPIQTLSPGSIVGWINQLAFNLAPYAAFFLCGRVWNTIHILIWPHILKRLPKPSKPEQYTTLRSSPVERRATLTEDQWQTVPESPTLGAADREIRHGRNLEQDIPTLQALEGQSAASAEGGSSSGGGIPLGTLRRQSTFSSRGGGGTGGNGNGNGGDADYGTDEEDADMVNPTLISFDVDTESTEQPAGVWSAELRPSFGNGGGDAGGGSRESGAPNYREEPMYVVNALTSLPSVLAADILTNFVTYILCAPGDAWAIRYAARTFAQHRGLATTGMFAASVGLRGGMSWRGAGNLIGLEVVRLLVSGEVWALISGLSQWLHVTEDEWREFHKEEQEEKERERRREAASEAATRFEEAVAATDEQ